MENNIYELKALRCGFIINTCLSIVGIIFYLLTKSMSIFLDMIIATVLVVSSIISIYVSKYVYKKYKAMVEEGLANKGVIYKVKKVFSKLVGKAE